jgi:hypothetical protein
MVWPCRRNNALKRPLDRLKSHSENENAKGNVERTKKLNVEMIWKDEYLKRFLHTIGLDV